MKREIYLLKIVILCLLFLLVGKSAVAQTEFSINGRVMAGGSGTNVRDSSGNVLFTQTAGVHGTIINGPSTNPAFTGNAWQIRWDSKPPVENGHAEGWSAESVIALAPLAGDVPQPNFSSHFYTTDLQPSGLFPTYAPDSIGGTIGSLGNCTWYANGRLRELGYNSTELNALNRNAQYWATDAAYAGIRVDKNPTVGSIAQLNGCTSGCFSTKGHVAVVESVNADGTITVTESSYSTATDKIDGVYNYLWHHRTVAPTWFTNNAGGTDTGNFIHVSPQSTSITDPDITALANTTQPVYWFYIAVNNFSKWYIVETNSSPNPAVMLLNSVDPNVAGGIRWKPISNYPAFAGFPAAGINFSSVAASPDGKSITFGGLSTSQTDPDITALANTTQPVYWFYIAVNNFSKWYIVETNSSPNPAVMLLNSVDPNVAGGIRWKPISNYPAFAGFPAAGINFSSVAASPDGKSITFGGLSH